MADRVLAIVDGKLAAAGDVAAIRRAMLDTPYRVRVEAGDPRQLASALLQSAAVEAVSIAGRALEVETPDLSSLGYLLPRLARDLDLRLSLFEPEDLSLESVFRYLVRRR
jgi:ABC-2 type transport system ATP-binding protein